MRKSGCVIAFLCCVLCAASLVAVDDAVKMKSTEMNSASYAAARSAAGGRRVLFLGNSITLHGPAPKIGWTNCWGMAASAQAKDYVHLVVKGLEERSGSRIDCRIRNLAAFERGYWKWDIAKELEKDIAWQPEIVVVALGENVPGYKSPEDEACYRRQFEALLAAFQQGKTKPVICVRGVFWPNPAKDRLMKAASDAVGARWVVAADLGKKDENKAIGLFAHPGVAGHPGDRGMAALAERILKALPR